MTFHVFDGHSQFWLWIKKSQQLNFAHELISELLAEIRSFWFHDYNLVVLSHNIFNFFICYTHYDSRVQKSHFHFEALDYKSCKKMINIFEIAIEIICLS